MKVWKKIEGVECLYQNINGKFYARLNKPKKTFRSLDTNKLKLAKQRIRTLALTNSEPPEIKSDELTLGEIINMYVDEELDKIKVAPKTKRRLKQAFSNVEEIKFLWNARLETLTSTKIKREIDRGLSLSNASKNYCLYGINKVIAYAQERDLLGLDRLLRVKGFRVSPRKLILPTDNQFVELVKSLMYPLERDYRKAQLPMGWVNMNTQQLMQRMMVSRATVKRRISESRGLSCNRRKGRPETVFTFLLLCYTGLRLGEAKELTWKDIQPDRIIVRGTKSSSAFRFLPIFPELMGLIDSIAKYRGDVKKSDKVMGRQRIDKALKRACKMVGIQYLRHHDLRHYFATKAVQAGIDMPTIAKWLGHADGGTLAMKVYSNIIDDHYVSSAEKLNRSLNFDFSNHFSKLL